MNVWQRARVHLLQLEFYVQLEDWQRELGSRFRVGSAFATSSDERVNLRTQGRYNFGRSSRSLGTGTGSGANDPYDVDVVPETSAADFTAFTNSRTQGKPSSTRERAVGPDNDWIDRKERRTFRDNGSVELVEGGEYGEGVLRGERQQNEAEWIGGWGRKRAPSAPTPLLVQSNQPSLDRAVAGDQKRNFSSKELSATGETVDGLVYDTHSFGNRYCKDRDFQDRSFEDRNYEDRSFDERRGLRTGSGRGSDRRARPWRFERRGSVGCESFGDRARDARGPGATGFGHDLGPGGFGRGGGGGSVAAWEAFRGGAFGWDAARSAWDSIKSKLNSGGDILPPLPLRTGLRRSGFPSKPWPPDLHPLHPLRPSDRGRPRRSASESAVMTNAYKYVQSLPTAREKLTWLSFTLRLLCLRLRGSRPSNTVRAGPEREAQADHEADHEADAGSGAGAEAEAEASASAPNERSRLREEKDRFCMNCQESCLVPYLCPVCLFLYCGSCYGGTFFLRIVGDQCCRRCAIVVERYELFHGFTARELEAGIYAVVHIPGLKPNSSLETPIQQIVAASSTFDDKPGTKQSNDSKNSNNLNNSNSSDNSNNLSNRSQAPNADGSRVITSPSRVATMNDKDGSVNDGSVNDGSAKDGSAKDGSVEDGSEVNQSPDCVTQKRSLYMRRNLTYQTSPAASHASASSATDCGGLFCVPARLQVQEPIGLIQPCRAQQLEDELERLRCRYPSDTLMDVWFHLDVDTQQLKFESLQMADNVALLSGAVLIQGLRNVRIRKEERRITLDLAVTPLSALNTLNTHEKRSDNVLRRLEVRHWNLYTTNEFEATHWAKVNILHSPKQKSYKSKNYKSNNSLMSVCLCVDDQTCMGASEPRSAP